MCHTQRVDPPHILPSLGRLVVWRHPALGNPRPTGTLGYTGVLVSLVVVGWDACTMLLLLMRGSGLGRMSWAVGAQSNRMYWVTRC